MVKGKLGAKGFSLVELMVVVAIIGILAAVAIPNFQRFQRKARQTEATSLLGGIHSAEAAFLGQWENYTTALDTAGYVPDGTLKYNAGFGAALASGFSGGVVPTDYTGPAPSALFSVRSICAAAAYMNRCQNNATQPGAVTLAVPPAGVGNNATYTAGADGVIGGATNDTWTMTNAKVMMNVMDGTL